MITLRQMSVAFLIQDNKLLLMEKPNNARLLPGIFVPIGGHLEHHEINNPSGACLREVEEETGLVSEELHGMKLKYIILRIKETEIRIQYVYFAQPKHMNVRSSPEGNLLWIDLDRVDKLNVTATTKFIIKHYAENNSSSDVFVGTMKAINNEPEITWAILEDWEMNDIALRYTS